MLRPLPRRSAVREDRIFGEIVLCMKRSGATPLSMFKAMCGHNHDHHDPKFKHKITLGSMVEWSRDADNFREVLSNEDVEVLIAACNRMGGTPTLSENEESISFRQFSVSVKLYALEQAYSRQEEAGRKQQPLPAHRLQDDGDTRAAGSVQESTTQRLMSVPHTADYGVSTERRRQASTDMLVATGARAQLASELRNLNDKWRKASTKVLGLEQALERRQKRLAAAEHAHADAQWRLKAGERGAASHAELRAQRVACDGALEAVAKASDDVATCGERLGRARRAQAELETQIRGARRSMKEVREGYERRRYTKGRLDVNHTRITPPEGGQELPSRTVRLKLQSTQRAHPKQLSNMHRITPVVPLSVCSSAWRRTGTTTNATTVLLALAPTANTGTASNARLRRIQQPLMPLWALRLLRTAPSKRS